MRSPERLPASVGRSRWRDWAAVVAVAVLAACAAPTRPGRPVPRAAPLATRPPPPAARPTTPPKPAARPVPAVPSPTPWYVTASSLNLRRCPGVECGRIGVLRQGDVVLRLREDGEWAEVRVVRTGQTGWVANEFLEEQPEAGPERPTAPGPAARGSPPPRPAPPGGPVKEEFLE